MNRTWKVLAGAVVAASLVVAPLVGVTAANATDDHGQPDMICSEAGYETKVDTEGDPATVDYTAPEGFLVDAYCVKAGTTKHIVSVNPPAASVVIDHPEKDSVSHYQVHLVPVPDEEEPPKVAVPAQPTAEAGVETCVDGVSVDANGTITLPAFEGGHWAEGEGTLTDVAPGEYGFTPVIHEGYVYEGPSMLFVTVPASVDVDCEVPIQQPNCTTVTGHQYITGDGVLSVDGEWATAHIDVPFTGTLADIGTVLDVEASLTQYLGLHIDTAEGTIVFEEEPSYGGNLWSTSAWEGVNPGMGYAAFGSIEEYIAYNGDVSVTGIRLLYTHPEASSTTVESFTIGCTVYEFRTIPDQPEDVVVTSQWSEPEVTCDNEPLDVVTITRTITTTTFVWDEEAWEWVEGETTVVPEEGTYVVTSADIEALECPVTPTPTETPSAPQPASNPGALATTGGGDVSPLIPTAAVLASVLGALLVALGAIRRRRQSA